MGVFFNWIYTLWNQIAHAVSEIHWSDVIDIIVIALLIYKAIEFLRETRAGQLVKGILILLAVWVVSKWLELTMLRRLLSFIMDSAIIALAIIFQPELRRVLEQIGRTKLSRGQLLDDEGDRLTRSIDNICKAAGQMQERRVGALIVFERTTQLGEIINTGTVVDAEASVSLTNGIFFPNSPLHDGAMIVRDGRIYAAGCILPLTQSQEVSSRLGTRHRAGIGMTENSDAVVLIVSEETGNISIAVNGQIRQDYNAVSACSELRRLLIDPEQERKDTRLVSSIRHLVPSRFRKDEKKEQGGEDNE